MKHNPEEQAATSKPAKRAHRETATAKAAKSF